MAASPPSLRTLIAPVTAETFFTSILGQQAAYFAGPDDRFAEIFSWSALNGLLEQSKLWTDRTLKVVLDGRDVDASEYCRSGLSREGQPAMLVEPAAIERFLERGATLVLDLVETLDAGVREVSAALQASLGGAVVCNVYCSWKAHQGFLSHYDTTDVVVLHIEGRKRWRLYEGRAQNPVAAPGFDFGSFPAEHHARMKGAIAREVELTPGDVLYIPRGQYHDALARSESSLHLSFGINQATGLDLIGLLRQSLPEDPLLRASLPHFDDAEGHHRHLTRLARRLAEVLSSPGMSERVRAWQEERALRDGLVRFDLPARGGCATFRVMSLGATLEQTPDGSVLDCRGQTMALDASRADAVAWVLGRDWFRRDAMRGASGALDEPDCDALLEELEALGLIRRLPSTPADG